MNDKKQFCDFCDSKGVTHKKECTKDSVIENKPDSFVSAQEFKGFQEETRQGIDLILAKLEEGKDVVPALEDIDELSEVGPLDYTEPMHPKMKVLVNSFFDPADGFTIIENYPDRNRVTVDVPQKFSNATEAHWTNVKEDKRTSSPILESGDQYYEEVEKFLERVVKQLRYDRNAVRK